MPTPFPGMDPYLERPGLWEEVHTGLIVGIPGFLNPLLRPRYRVAIKQRVYLALLPPDVRAVLSPRQAPNTRLVTTSVGVMPRAAELPAPEEVIERYLQICDVETGDVVTIVEILSSTHKSSHEGRKRYGRRRFQVLGSMAHLVEIDLLRAGEPFPFHVSGGDVQSDYRIIVSRTHHRPYADTYLFNVRDPIPDIPIPLQRGETEPILCLNQVLHQLYDQAGYDLRVDYQGPPNPPLTGKDARWMAQLLRQ